MHPVRRTVADTTRRLIHRFYEQFWNARQYDLADRLMARDSTFHGTLGSSRGGPEGMVEYAQRMTRAFPDLQIRIDDLIVERDRAAAHISCTGTHEGELFGCSGTGRRVRYDCVVLFRVAHGRISDVQVYMDRGELRRQLSSVDRRSVAPMDA